MTSAATRAWFDHNNVVCFRDDVTIAEGRELQRMLKDAFNRGLRQGYDGRRDALDRSGVQVRDGLSRDTSSSHLSWAADRGRRSLRLEAERIRRLLHVHRWHFAGWHSGWLWVCRCGQQRRVKR